MDRLKLVGGAKLASLEVHIKKKGVLFIIEVSTARDYSHPWIRAQNFLVPHGVHCFSTLPIDI